MNMETKLKALALRLHSLSERDKQWILQNLSGDERNKIQALLNDLKIRGITTDSDIIKQSIDTIRVRKQSSEDHDDKLSEFINLVEKMDEEKLLQILLREDAWIIALLMEINDWRWQENLEKRLSANQKMQCKQYQQKEINKVKPEVQLALLRIISELDLEDDLQLDSANSTMGIAFEASLQSQATRTSRKHKRWWRGLWQ